MRNKNISAAIVLIIFGIFYGFLTANLPDRSLPNTPSPAFFPWIITGVILVLSVWLLVRGLRQPKAESEPIDMAKLRLAATAMVFFLLYLVIMPVLGFVLATLPFFAAMMVLYGEKRPIWIGSGAVGVTAVLYIVFRHGFGVFLPQGLLRGIIT
ncbi:MAG: tripartite tricarboxylate transporter TctB family protein [Pseudomonadota bacterium]